MEKEKSARAKIEALLFVAGEPLAISRISKAVEISPGECQSELEKMEREYREIGSGLKLVFKDKEVQIVSHENQARLIAEFLNKNLNEPLSSAALEVLSVIAYRGPVTRAQVEHLRGVNCSFTIRNLAMRGLVERKENPNDSRSYIYEASFELLKSLGLGAVSELPDYQILSKVFEEKKSEMGSEDRVESKETPEK